MTPTPRRCRPLQIIPPILLAVAALFSGCSTLSRQLDSVVRIQTRAGSGASGVIVAHEKNIVYILTVRHVADLGPTTRITFRDGGMAAGWWIAKSGSDDLALAACYREEPVQVATIGTQAQCTLGQRVRLIGYPTTSWPHWTNGELVSGGEREVASNVWAAGGYSGGPLVDPETGVVLAIFASTLVERIPVHVQTQPYRPPVRGVGYVRLNHISLAVPAGRIRAFLEGRLP